MLVHIQAKYGLMAEDYKALVEHSPTKVRYWCMNLDTKDFVDHYLPREQIPTCDKPLDINVNLPPGRYLFGAGDKNLPRVSHPDWKNTVRVYVTISNKDGATVWAGKDRDQMPSLADILAYDAANPTFSAPANQSSASAPAVTPAPAPVTAPVSAEPSAPPAYPSSDTVEMVSVTDGWYCSHEGITVTESSATCENFEFGSGKNLGPERMCGNCAFANPLFREKKSE